MWVLKERGVSILDLGLYFEEGREFDLEEIELI